ncbi:uncharacterized protein LOC110999592 [Pieris rapae]|uniref:uncharacterized protein LOC110999592 n=1 Tax=Pieris rapae TaxID=64459 RepID=UPI001E27D6A5|nr:uncharacterized protein LOC110999592 [Pieris rapae]
MVNYCCVVGCGRNSKSNRHLNFYSLPKQKHRQKQWLKAAGKEDLLNQDMEKLRRNLRFCSRHFPPSSIKNKHLNIDAVPSVRLPGSLPEQDILPTVHEGITCNVCSEQIVGFRYKCVMCNNYDLCQKCEMLELHEDHYMLRIPKSIKFKIADTFINKWRELIECENKTSALKVEDSSDDEPITKYRKSSGVVNLPETVKSEIRNEIQRAIKSLSNTEKEARITDGSIELINVTNNTSLKPVVESVYENNLIENSSEIPTQIVFADVNNMKCEDDKSEAMAALSVVNTSTASGHIQPVIYLKLNDVLTQLMITPSDQTAQINDSNIF